ncbi:PAS domain-containing sensor histidine kinase [Syntrophomonas palmitatica]|uniref:PAS domain-containing sensor histidine kinase n=1 Tax=Syntrophomonas palmitatica TaxID=402877 RepID=UPI00155DD1B8|nr:ATP-binding protein [Syntrophomonas palmitatica]
MNDSENMTDRKRVEEALFFSEDRFSKAYNAVPLTMSITTFEEGRFISVNDSFCRFVGYSKEEILGTTSSELGFWYDPNQRFEMKKIITENDTVRDMEILFVTKSGEIRQGLYSAEKIDINGETCLLSILTDITEQFKLAEERQELKDQIDKVYRLLMLNSESAGIIHEITQPVNAIKLLVESMLYFYNTEGSADAMELIKTLQYISKEVNRIEKTIVQIRSFTRKRQVADFRPCNLNDAVHISVSIFEFRLSADGICVQLDLSENLPQVPGDLNWLVTMIKNLLENAIQALDKVKKSDKEIHCNTRLIKNKVILEVVDNATGISNEQIDRIFQPFYSTKDIGENTGLGLAIVESIVKSIGGRIGVFNNDRGGATFHIELPVWEEFTPNKS